MKRQQAVRKKKRQRNIFLLFSFGMATLLAGVIYWGITSLLTQENVTTDNSATLQTVASQTSTSQQPKKVKIMASGDMLYHVGLYEGAWNGDGTFDFDNDYTQIKPLISSADIAIGDFEGTIRSDYPLAGYPLFNAPKDVIKTIKDAGYDAIDLAHNHILDSGLTGLKTTYQAFEENGISPFGVNVDTTDKMLIKEVNGVKVAILGFSYGFNGLEVLLTDEEYNTHLKDLDVEKVKADIQKAEELADVTVVMPQMGIEYMLTPSQAQKEMYHNMVEWGADIIFGGHPHVIQPTEIVEKDGESKFIIYSMGNLISNQRIETMDDTPNSQWTERGVIVEVDVEVLGGKVNLVNIALHPTWVSKEPFANKQKLNGGQAFDYQVFLGEDYIEGGQYANEVDDDTRQRIQNAYYETLELLDLQFKR